MQRDAETYRNILESLPAAVYVVDRRRGIVLWNSGAEKITGYLRHEVIGRLCHQNLLMHCDETNAVLCDVACPLVQTMHDGQPRNSDVFLLHKNGQRVPVRMQAIPVRDEDGTIVGAAECFAERTVRVAERRAGNALSLDEATGLPDRAATEARLCAALNDLRASAIPFCVLSIRLEGLGLLQRDKGCRAIEELLYAAGQTLAADLRSNDILGRWSENRFVAVLTRCDGSALGRVALRLKWLIHQTSVPWWGERISASVSIGAVPGRPEDSVEILLARAEANLA